MELNTDDPAMDPAMVLRMWAVDQAVRYCETHGAAEPLVMAEKFRRYVQAGSGPR